MKIVLFLMLALIAMNTGYAAQGPKNNNNNNGQSPVMKGILEDQVDPTDVLAIPADNSEVELNEDFEQLEEMQREYQEKHHNR